MDGLNNTRQMIISHVWGRYTPHTEASTCVTVAIRANVKTVIVHLNWTSPSLITTSSCEHVQWPSYMIHDAYSSPMTAPLNDQLFMSISSSKCMYGTVCFCVCELYVSPNLLLRIWSGDTGLSFLSDLIPSRMRSCRLGGRSACGLSFRAATWNHT